MYEFSGSNIWLVYIPLMLGFVLLILLIVHCLYTWYKNRSEEKNDPLTCGGKYPIDPFYDEYFTRRPEEEEYKRIAYAIAIGSCYDACRMRYRIVRNKDVVLTIPGELARAAGDATATPLERDDGCVSNANIKRQKKELVNGSKNTAQTSTTVTAGSYGTKANGSFSNERKMTTERTQSDKSIGFSRGRKPFQSPAHSREKAPSKRESSFI